jgi:hypothetical protein
MNGGPRLATLAQVQQAVREEYDRLWSQWFVVGRHTQATLDGNTDSVDAFRPRANILIIGLGDGFADDPTILSRQPITNRFDSAPWMVRLVHELIHEFECKVIREPTEEGIELFLQCESMIDCRFGVAKHGTMFCTAVADRAINFFQIPAIQLLGLI